MLETIRQNERSVKELCSPEKIRALIDEVERGREALGIARSALVTAQSTTSNDADFQTYSYALASIDGAAIDKANGEIPSNSPDNCPRTE